MVIGYKYYVRHGLPTWAATERLRPNPPAGVHATGGHALLPGEVEYDHHRAALAADLAADEQPLEERRLLLPTRSQVVHTRIVHRRL